MTQPSSSRRRVLSPTVIYIPLLSITLMALVILELANGQSAAARPLNIALFATLSVAFFHNALRPFGWSTEIGRGFSMIGGIAWMIFAILIILGKVTGF